MGGECSSRRWGWVAGKPGGWGGRRGAVDGAPRPTTALTAISRPPTRPLWVGLPRGLALALHGKGMPNERDLRKWLLQKETWENSRQISRSQTEKVWSTLMYAVTVGLEELFITIGLVYLQLPSILPTAIPNITSLPSSAKQYLNSKCKPWEHLHPHHLSHHPLKSCCPPQHNINSIGSAVHGSISILDIIQPSLVPLLRGDPRDRALRRFVHVLIFERNSPNR